MQFLYGVFQGMRPFQSWTWNNKINESEEQEKKGEI